jgi:ankyrin repeat protein
VTPLLAAIESKHEALVKLLLERGADPNLGAQGGMYWKKIITS